MKRIFFSFVVLATPIVMGGACPPPPPPPPPPPNILLIYTDDQRADTIEHMPKLQAEIVNKGVLFTRSYVSVPLCCPDRAGTYSGKWGHNTGVVFNRDTGVIADAPGIDLPNGGIFAFDWDSAIPKALQAKGYKTGLFGKVMNMNESYSPAVPPGWDAYSTYTQDGFNFLGETSDWYNANPADYYYNDNGVVKPAKQVRDETPVYGPIDPVKDCSGFNQAACEADPDCDWVDPNCNDTPNDYSTDLSRDQAIEWLLSLPTDQPFFLVWTPYAPHFDRGFYNLPPAKRHDGDFSTYSDNYTHPPSFNEPDITDKPEWLQNAQASIMTNQAGVLPNVDNLRERTLESLLSVDEGIFEFLKKLDERGQGKSTMIVYTSDNGYSWGEHRLGMKALPYEESVKVPLVIRYLDKRPAAFPSQESLLVSNVDIAPTIAGLANVTSMSFNGTDLMPIIDATVTSWRTALLTECWTPESTIPNIAVPNLFPVIPDWSLVVTNQWKYVDYETGTDELYDLTNDPYELNNEISNPAHASTITTLQSQLSTLLAE